MNIYLSNTKYCIQIKFVRVLFQIVFLFSFFVIFSCLFKSSVYAATYCTSDSGNCYVDGVNGLDTNDGKTTTTAWKTIQKAANTVGAGDTVNVKGGITYAETNSCGGLSAALCLTNSGTSGNYITYRAWPGTGSPIINSGSNYVAIGNYIKTLNYIKIIGFTIKNIQKVGIAFGGMATAGLENYVINNILYDEVKVSGTAGIYSSGESSTAYVYNNIVYNLEYGIHTDSGTISIKNNTAYENTYGISGNGGAAVTMYVDYNDSYNNTVNYATGNMLRGGHDLSIDPQFTDITNYNFTLKSTSPLVDAGTSLASVPTDILGVSRPLGNGTDIGAYESSYSQSILPTPDVYYTTPKNLMTQLAIFTGEAQGSQFGMMNLYKSVTLADINGDGKDDLLVGARHSYPYSGLYIFNGKTTPTDTLAANADIRVRNTADTSFTDSISVGDINDDGKLEMLATDYSGNGKAYIFEVGSNFASRSVTAADYVISGTHSNSFGAGAAIIGDVNDDGYNDYIIQEKASTTKKIYLFYGGPTLSNKSDTNADVVYTAGNYDTSFTTPGDVNGDGIDDIVIFRYGGSGAGGVYIFFGSKNLSSKTLDTADVIITGTSYCYTGNVALGDVNGDGYTDIAFSYDIRVLVFLGGPQLSSTNANQAYAIFKKDPSQAAGGMDTAVGMEDINHDGITDLITSDSYLPRTFVFYGGKNFASKDGRSADLVYDYITVSRGAAGGWLVTGDYNGDGYKDIAAGFGMYNLRQGRVYLFTAPHDKENISITSSNYTNGTISGKVQSESINIGGVEINVDNTGWNQCTAKDGSFNSLNEDYQCPILGVNEGSHHIKIRSYNDLGVYVLNSAYPEKDVVLDTVSPSNTVIKTLGLIDNIPNKDNLTYYFTSTTPEVKGIADSLNTVSFVSNNKTYTTTADNNGNYTIKIDNLSLGTNDLTYYSSDLAGNESTHRNLTMIVGTSYFPQWLLEELGLVTQPDNEDTNTTTPDTTDTTDNTGTTTTPVDNTKTTEVKENTTKKNTIPVLVYVIGGGIIIGCILLGIKYIKKGREEK